MGKRILTLLCALLACSAFGQQDGKLHIKVENIRKAEGRIMIAVYDSDDKFLSRSIVTGTQLPVKQDGSLDATIDLSFGYYAISIFHDENNNGKLDRTLFGIPSEDYGFSNDAKGFIGPPSYEAARFRFQKQDQEIVIRIQ